MKRRHTLLLLLVAMGWVLGLTPAASPAQQVPARLDDKEFWRLIETMSEPAGYFNSDNLISNEDTYLQVIPALLRGVGPGDAYVGVGPDQNFTYIAAINPSVAFIPDVRRGNLQLHLMYKALFALSSDRVEFLSRLFSRRQPAELPRDVSVQDLMTAFAAAEPDNRLFQTNLRAVFDFLARHRGAPLDETDRSGIEFVYGSFFAAGPELTFVSNAGFRRGRYPTYAALQAATDLDGVPRAFLASEPLYQRVKSLQGRNLVIPLVGNFSGPMTLTAIGQWVRSHGGRVTAFYTSNVEQYLFQDRVWDRFRRNVATMPIDHTSTFIRSCFNSCSSPGGARAVTLLDSVPDLLDAAANGRIGSYWDLLIRSRGPEAP